MKVGRVLMILLIFLSTGVSAQYFNGSNTFWKQQRHSFGFGVGVANFLGELGGRDQVGSDFIYDLEWSAARPVFQANYRYQLGSRVYAKAQFAFGVISGNDALTEEIFKIGRAHV